jgi:DNA-binding response OmpR family regulator
LNQTSSFTEVNLVILDLRLGQEDGLDLLREVRSSSDVPIIIITGHRAIALP